jgi:hypothetical protein
MNVKMIDDAKYLQILTLCGTRTRFLSRRGRGIYRR